MAAAAPQQAQVSISRIATETLIVPIVGTAPLLVHRFAEKAKRQMLDAMQGRKTPKEARDPERDYQDAFYKHDDGSYGFPVIAFKAATVGGARYYGKSTPMTVLRQSLFFDAPYSHAAGQKLVHIEGEPHMREDVVTVGISGHDLRYRPEFSEWRTELAVTYVSSMLTRDSVLSLIDAGGIGVGVGEWRVEKKGDFGTYQIDEGRKLKVLESA